MSDRAFSLWLAENDLDDLARHSREALIKIGEHSDMARDILAETDRRSVELVWLREIKPRLSVPERSGTSREMTIPAETPETPTIPRQSEEAPAVETAPPAASDPAPVSKRMRERLAGILPLRYPMRMASAKRRRCGRPRKYGKRHPGGRLVGRRDAGPTDEILAQRAAVVGNDNARDPHAGWLPGQLLLRGVITPEQHEAARRWHADAVAYRRLLEGQRPVRAIVLDLPTGSAPVDDARKYARLKQRYDLAYEAVAVRGRHVLRAVVDAVFHERAGDAALIREGLEALRRRLRL